MTLPIYGLLAALVVALAAFRVFCYRNWRRGRIAGRPFPEQWHRFLLQNWPLYRRLSTSERQRLQRRILVFLDEKAFYPCGGMALDDNGRCLIAAQASLLTLNLPVDCYDALQSILVYPDAYRARHDGPDEHGIWQEDDLDREGESWDNGRILLSWEDVLDGARDDHDGFNLVLHEFAHQLDAASGSTNGAPVLSNRATAQRWQDAFSRAYKQHCREVSQHRDTVIDPYGATNPAEFFAVLTELFFEAPQKLQEAHGDLFELLTAFYRIDPRTWNSR